jgi:hypothetical protein
MFKVPCVVEFGRGEIDVHLTSIRLIVGLGGVTVNEVNVENREGHINEYSVEGLTNVRVFCWENVHPSEWSPELIQVNESFV